MSKDFTQVAFNHLQFKKELDQFHAFLTSAKILGEREIQEFLKASLHLTAYIGTKYDLYAELNEGYEHYSAAFTVEPPAAQGPSTKVPTAPNGTP